MTKLVRYITGIIANPVSAFRMVLVDKPFVIVFSMVIVLGIAGSAIVYFSPSTSSLTTEDRIIVLLFPVIGLLLWFVLSLLLYLGGRRLGGKATFKDIILITGMANTVLIMFVFISYILLMLIRFAHIEVLSHIAISIFIDCIFILWFWVLIIIGTREAQGFSTGRAIGAIIIAALYVFAILILLSMASYLPWMIMK